MSYYSIDAGAIADIESIYRHIARGNEPAAIRLIERLYEAFDFLLMQPEMGELRPDLSTRIRMHTCGNFVILYEPTHYGIAIARVVHAARDLQAVFRRPGSG